MSRQKASCKSELLEGQRTNIALDLGLFLDFETLGRATKQKKNSDSRNSLKLMNRLNGSFKRKKVSCRKNKNFRLQEKKTRWEWTQTLINDGKLSRFRFRRTRKLSGLGCTSRAPCRDLRGTGPVTFRPCGLHGHHPLGQIHRRRRRRGLGKVCWRSRRH